MIERIYVVLRYFELEFLGLCSLALGLLVVWYSVIPR